MMNDIRYVERPYVDAGCIVVPGEGRIPIADPDANMRRWPKVSESILDLIYVQSRARVLAAARAEGWMLVREGMADVLGQLGEDVYP